MSGRQAKVTRREIRRSAESGLRTMQEQQEAVIKAAIQRCNEVTVVCDLLSARLTALEKRVGALDDPLGPATPNPLQTTDNPVPVLT